MTNAAVTEEAPNFIERDTYEGRQTVLRRQARAGSFTAAEIADLSPTGIIWESFGHPFPGREGFGRSRYVAAPDGSLHIYAADGHKVIVHPADRRIRVLTA